MKGAEPNLVRASVCSDHRVKAQFSDNSIMLLSSTGDRFIHCDRNGARVNQLSEFAMGRYVRKLAQVVQFRNMHLDKPVHCSSLNKNKIGGMQHTFTLGYEVSSVRWGKWVEGEFVHGRAAIEENGKVMLESEDGLAQMLLHKGWIALLIKLQFEKYSLCVPYSSVGLSMIWM